MFNRWDILGPGNEGTMDYKAHKVGEPSTERQHGKIDFYTMQFLSGHGYFQSYLHKMGIFVSPDLSLLFRNQQ